MEERKSCCTAGEAIASAAAGPGPAADARLRRNDSGGAPGTRPAEEDLALYDDPEVQRAFVRGGPDGREAVLLLEGLRCAACALRNEQALSCLPGVLGAEVNYATHRASVRWDPSRIRLSDILAAVRKIGYRAHPHDPARVDALDRGGRRDALGRLFVAGLGMMQVMMYALPAYIAGEGEMSADIGQLLRWASLALTLPVVGYSAAPFFGGAWRDLRVSRLGMDVPVALGIGVAFGASVFATLAGAGEVYFDSVAMFVFLLLLGRYLSLVARGRAARSLQHLGRLVPEFAHRLREFPRSLETERVAAAALRAGDRVLVRPGETFPADGAVQEGAGAVSEALLSGEAKPKAKRAGDAVIAGAVNLSNPLVVKVEKTGADTVLSSVLRLIERAAAEKPRLIELADRTAAWFILFVLVLAALAGIYWAASAPERALPVVVAVLVATCPCALSLATPVALTVAIAELAARGFVVARHQAVEALARATDVVLDKTGTLTPGELRLAGITPLARVSAEDCLALAAAIESASEHPIAKALAAAGARSPALPIAAIRNVPGAGIEARVDGRLCRIGTPGFAAGLAPGSVAAVQGGEDGSVWLGDPSGVLAAFRFGDELRPEAAEAVAALQALGLRVHLLSGDGERPTRDLARRAGIDIVRAQAGPDGKRRYAADLQRRGRVVAMVGDGINDAPVLAQADISVAMGNGTRIAQTRADAVLLSEDLRELPRAVGYARRTLRVVRQNLAWAFAYNVLVLPLAVSGFLSPWAAAIGMSASSLLVVLNALRLQDGRWRRRRSAAAPERTLSPA
ncbi:MAG: heavy metal translocating P-type ATPase [Burkholderiales bacterium]